MSTLSLAPRTVSAVWRSGLRGFPGDALIALAFMLTVCIALAAFIAVFRSVDAGAAQGTIAPDGTMLVLPP